MKGRKRLRLAWAWLGLFALGLLELCGAVAFANRAPREEEWSKLAPLVESVHRPGDLVVVSPRWAEPHARRALGDDAFPLDVVARSGPETFDRAIEVSILGSHAAELDGFREVKSSRLGPFTVRELENPRPEHVVFDFVRELGPGRVVVPTDDGEPCAWTTRAKLRSGGLGGHPTFPRARFECPEGLFFQVSATVIADEDFLPRRCIWAHPPESGKRVIRYARVPLGDRIVGHLGMYWMIERERAGAPVALAVRVDGEEVGRVLHEDGEGWKRFEMPLGARAHRPEATVEFEVATSDFLHRHLCFQADSR
ncbi:MAG: hypothetical protein JNL21_30830 [Myxococcales bacterium]|nr:hypothetical protein [Myxococcales bacterium]